MEKIIYINICYYMNHSAGDLLRSHDGLCVDLIVSNFYLISNSLVNCFSSIHQDDGLPIDDPWS